jgi:hypothetical protein
VAAHLLGETSHRQRLPWIIDRVHGRTWDSRAGSVRLEVRLGAPGAEPEVPLSRDTVDDTLER